MSVKRFELNIWRDSDHSLVIRFLFSYLIILMVPVFIGTLVYQEAIRIVESDVKTTNLATLGQCRDIVDQQLAAIDTMKNQIGLTPQLGLALKNDNTRQLSFYYEMRKLMNELRPYAISGNIVDNFFIYMREPNYIISPEMAYDADFFFRSVFKYKGMSQEQWMTELKNYHSGFVLPASQVTLESRNLLVIPYIYSLPITYHRKVDGAITFLLNAQAMQELLHQNTLVKGGWVMILDQDNQIITGLPKQEIPQKVFTSISKKAEGFKHSYFWGERMIVSHTTSSYNGWKYVSVLPSKLVMRKVIYIKAIVWGSIILSLIIGALIAYWLTARNTKPLTKILGLIKEHLKWETEKEEDALQFLQGSVSQLINNNQRLQETVKNYMPIIRTVFYDRLLKGDFNNLEQIEAVSSYLGLQIKGDKFLVLILRFGRDDIFNREIIEEASITKMVLSEIINKHLEGLGYLHDLGQNNIAILLAFDDCQKEQCYQKVEQVVSRIRAEIARVCNLNVRFSGGKVYESLLDVWQSFQEAQLVFDYKTPDNDSNLFWFSDLPHQSAEYYYPIDYEQRLMNYLKAGEIKQVKNLLHTIYQENIENRQIPPETCRELIYELKGTIVKIYPQLNVNKTVIETALNRVDFSQPLEAYRSLLEIYLNICMEVIGNRKFRNVQLKDKIIAYINDFYQQPDLSLHKVASHFGLSEGYLSHFFKDQVGENFLAYLENERIKHACELLDQGQLSVNDIAGQVGYNSVQSFRRAFKRVKGVNPTAFRDPQF